MTKPEAYTEEELADVRAHRGIMESVIETHVNNRLLATISERDARIEELEKEREWHPIERAPEDGREFIARWGRQQGVQQLVRYSRVHKHWMAKGEVIYGFKENATEWTERPTPPQTESK